MEVRWRRLQGHPPSWDAGSPRSQQNPTLVVLLPTQSRTRQGTDLKVNQHS
uniref:Uncharacterized protein n=1 Tax=Piliocolobus tephrosceles TaxID=591936 RepID=A0A8C9HII4_9PRIM